MQQDDLQRAQAIFEAVGRCIPVDEVHFNAVTALSGSGPGYQFLIMEALADAACGWGCRGKLALTLVAQTALGSARMVLSTGRHPAALRDDVTTPAAATIGGLLMLEDGRSLVLARAVEEAPRFPRISAWVPTRFPKAAAASARETKDAPCRSRIRCGRPRPDPAGRPLGRAQLSPARGGGGARRGCVGVRRRRAPLSGLPERVLGPQPGPLHPRIVQAMMEQMSRVTLTLARFATISCRASAKSWRRFAAVRWCCR